MCRYCGIRLVTQHLGLCIGRSLQYLSTDGRWARNIELLRCGEEDLYGVLTHAAVARPVLSSARVYKSDATVWGRSLPS